MIIPRLWAGLLAVILLSTPALAREQTKIYDRQWRLQYRVYGNHVYDRDWRLQYRLKGGKVYDRDWRLKYRIQRPGHKEKRRQGKWVTER